ncbi:MAG: Nif11-like leader peptide family natural product precursor [Spirochaetes bacterium]|nr:Nif11-like leader peptide family natural product precursor [Spirochaetota bacterium]
MSIKNAKTFISKVQEDSSFRTRLNKSSSASGVSEILLQEELSFTDEEFIEASSYILANSPSPGKTEELKELFQWYEILKKSGTD